MGWITNECHLFDGFDELYHQAKFGEDRTTRAGSNLFELCTPRTHGAPDKQTSVTDKKHSDKHHIFAPTTGARCTIFPKLCL